MSRLRRELGDAVVTRGGGYLIEVEPGSARPGSLHARWWTRAGARWRRGSPERAEERLREALQLWRGPPFAELGDDAFARIEGERLADLRLDAVEERIEAELALGRHVRGDRRAGGAGRPPPVPRASTRPADARALPRGPAGRGARGLPRRARRARGRARHRARPAPARAAQRDPGAGSRRSTARSARPAAAGGAGRGATPTAPAPATCGPLILGRRAARSPRRSLVVVLLAATATTTGPRSRSDSHAVVAIDPATNEVTDAALGRRRGPARSPSSRSRARSGSPTWTTARSRGSTRTRCRSDAAIAVGATPRRARGGGRRGWVATANRAQAVRDAEQDRPRLRRARPARSEIAACARREPPTSRACGEPPLGGAAARPPDRGGPAHRRHRTAAASTPAALAPSVDRGRGGRDLGGRRLDGNTVSRIDADSGSVRGDPGGQPAGRGRGRRRIGLGHARARRHGRARSTPETGAVRDTVTVGRSPDRGGGRGAARVWVANSGDGTVTRIDPRSGRVSATIAVGREPAGRRGGERPGLGQRPPARALRPARSRGRLCAWSPARRAAPSTSRSTRRSATGSCPGRSSRRPAPSS